VEKKISRRDIRSVEKKIKDALDAVGMHLFQKVHTYRMTSAKAKLVLPSSISCGKRVGCTNCDIEFSLLVKIRSRNKVK